MFKRNKLGQYIKGSQIEHTEESKKRLSEIYGGSGNPMYGKKESIEHRKKISQSLRSTLSHMKDTVNDKHLAVHQWMRKWYGQPQKCDFCDRTQPPQGKGLLRDYFHWANKNGQYLYERSNWQRLCSICHRNYDFNGHKPRKPGKRKICSGSLKGV